MPIYMRSRVLTMPEYLERRYGGNARTLYAVLIILSYVFVNFALVFYTGGFAVERMWGWDKLTVVWVLAIFTGAYTIYGGMASVAWTDLFQCVLLLGGGMFVFFAGMSHIGWDFQALLGAGQRAHLIAPSNHPEVPWPAIVILVLSTNVWYYATDQFINQRCLGAKNEWHAKMGILFAAGLQLLLPLATCFPGLVYYVINPNLENPDDAYTSVVAAVVPIGLRGLIVGAVLGAIMSTISGLVNSTSTMVTLDLIRRSVGRNWEEKKLVRVGQWSGGVALLIGALFAPVVMQWGSIFRYCQDIWGPMAAPAAVVFMGGALWKPGRERGALACLWLAVLTIPFTFLKTFLIDKGYQPLPDNLANSMIFSGGIFLLSIVLLVTLSLLRSLTLGLLISAVSAVPIMWLVNVSPAATAILIVAFFVVLIGTQLIRARKPEPNMWDRSMLTLPDGQTERWYKSTWFWWLVLTGCFGSIYAVFW